MRGKTRAPRVSVAARRRWRDAALAGLASVTFAGDASACKCAERSVEAHYEEARHVFLARVLEIQNVRDGAKRDGARHFSVSGGFRIDEAFKGNPGRLSRIGTGLGGGDCGIRLESGHRYVFFVDASGGAWACSGSREVARGDIDDARLLMRLRTLALEHRRDADAPRRAQDRPRK